VGSPHQTIPRNKNPGWATPTKLFPGGAHAHPAHPVPAPMGTPIVGYVKNNSKFNNNSSYSASLLEL